MKVLGGESNIEISGEELALVRRLSDFDLTMFLSELSEFNWAAGKALLPLIQDAMDKESEREDA